MPTTTFNTVGWHKWPVPNGVETVEVELHGGGSGTQSGGRVTGKMKVRNKHVLFIQVGEAGKLRTGADERGGGDTAFGGGGRGGDGKGSGRGGNGGGGASAIRIDARDGAIRAVAGGAGGNSGDGGGGGHGGGSVGAFGGTGSEAGATVGPATGGTQSQPGFGGTSSLGTAFSGKDGLSGRLNRGGSGAGPDLWKVNGGGGGGGGYYAGGGGHAGVVGAGPSGGGGGGSNYTGGLYAASNEQGMGGTGDGLVRITWLDPDDPNNPPTPPENITIDGKPIANGLATKAKNSVTLKGTPDDPNAGQGVRLYVWMSKHSDFRNHKVFRGTFNAQENRDVVELTGLDQDTRYYLRIYTQDNNGVVSKSYRSTNFWTNRRPNPPALTLPAENSQFTALVNITFQWNHIDDDPSDPQSAFRLRYRLARTPISEPGEWTEFEAVTSFEQWTVDAGTFKGNSFYEWQVKTRDQQDRWGEWSLARSFYITGDTTPPLLLQPIRDEAVVAGFDTTFKWKFFNPVATRKQDRADLRYRVKGTPDWVTIFGTTSDPGGTSEWVIAADTFTAGYRYEYQIRTYTDTGLASDWSESATFWAVVAPGSGAGLDVLESGQPQAPLGIGNNRVFIYDRGGQVLRGEITPFAEVTWHRKRDDISTAHVWVRSWDDELKGFLRGLRTWMHEVVIFRDGQRVWEGPITRISGTRGGLEIEAKDVMAYVYRRIMRQGYTDAHRVVNGQQIGLSTVVERAQQIVMNAMAYDDPNILAYLTPIHHPADATQSRVRKDYSRTAWEEVDDLAATAGLDYATSGRRIMLWDTHNPLGRLPEMRDGHFSEPPIITEYGMSLANYFAVTNGNGIWGAASKGLDENGLPGPEGFIEQLASAYGETEGAGSERTLTKAALRRLERSFAGQARRNIANRYPAPLVVRVPDNATLSPDINIGINQLIPGVWIPLRCTDGVREVAQWQKLDSISVIQNGEGEKVSVVMSPAPNAGEDPDAELAAEELL